MGLEALFGGVAFWSIWLAVAVGIVLIQCFILAFVVMQFVDVVLSTKSSDEDEENTLPEIKILTRYISILHNSTHYHACRGIPIAFVVA